MDDDRFDPCPTTSASRLAGPRGRERQRRRLGSHRSHSRHGSGSRYASLDPRRSGWGMDLSRTNGDRVCFIGRYNKADGVKEFRPRTWWKNRKTGEEKWRWKNVPDPRPLYGLELLAQRPNAPVMVVEGEKCADAARRIFPDHVVVSPMNGAQVAAEGRLEPAAWA